jgi:hypothetical protein
VHETVFVSRAAARAHIFEFIEVFYNRQRSALGARLRDACALRNDQLTPTCGIVNLSTDSGKFQL